MRLHIGVDAEKVVVSPDPLTMRTGRGQRRRYGSVTELIPVPPTGRTHDDRTRRLAALALPLLVLCPILDTLGISWWIAAAGSAALLAWTARLQARAARPGIIAVPTRDRDHVLIARPERTAYERTLAVARRVRRTWPGLGGLIDPADADRTLTRALDELAGLMARRQQLRRVRTELAQAMDGRSGAVAGVPADSPAVHALDAQRARVEQLWQATGAQANRMLRGIEAAALAGESLIRERQMQETARRAELTIARLAAGGSVAEPDAAPELAERTVAVITAYRDLNRL
ncbi:MAG TPA: hypothetical protein VFH03_20750 [Actinoplanes sp.]|nr:hypothetical protein [Actinoplanes sp.]